MVTALRGVMCAMVTPFDETADVDVAALERLVTSVVGKGATGICPVGSTGEGSRLTGPQRRSVVQRVRGVVPDDFFVMPSPLSGPPARTLDEIYAFADLGADAVLVAPPAAYLLADREVTAFYEELAASSPLPIVLYNFPAMTRVQIAPSVVAALAGHERIVGIKDSSRDLEYTQAVLYAAADADFAVLTGSDTLLLATLTLGGVGAVVGSANLVADLGMVVYQEAIAGDLPKARSAQQRLFDVVSAARAAGFPTGWKAALELAGICSARPAPPAVPVSGDALAALRNRLQELGVL